MRLFALSLLFFSTFIFAGETVSFNLDRVGVIQLARLVFSDVSNDSVVIGSRAVDVDRTVSLSLKNVQKAKAIDQITQLLKASGLSVVRRDGVVWIDVAQDEDKEEFYYSAKHRSVSYLVDSLSGSFPPGSFSTQRSGVSVGNSQGITVAPNGMVRDARQSPVIDTGTSVLSLADKNPDGFVFKGSTRDIERVKSLLEQVDTPLGELALKAVVYEVTTDNAEGSALGLAASLIGDKLKIKGNGSVATGDFSFAFTGTTFAAVYSALQTDSHFKEVSTSSVRVQSGKSAKLIVGAQTPVLASSQLDRNGNPVQAVEYKPSGIILNLTPTVRSGSVDLTVDQQISSFVATTTGVNNSPTLMTRQLSTSVGVRGNEVLVLGGLNDEQKITSAKGLPFLPDWLGSKSSSVKRTEILLVLQVDRI